MMPHLISFVVKKVNETEFAGCPCYKCLFSSDQLFTHIFYILYILVFSSW